MSLVVKRENGFREGLLFWIGSLFPSHIELVKNVYPLLNMNYHILKVQAYTLKLTASCFNSWYFITRPRKSSSSSFYTHNIFCLYVVLVHQQYYIIVLKENAVLFFMFDAFLFQNMLICENITDRKYLFQRIVLQNDKSS